MAVGSDAEVEPAIGPSTVVERLDGETVAPGFQDAHCHAVYGGLVNRTCNLHDLPDVDAYLAAVARYAADHPERPWIEGDGWTYAPFAGGMPHRLLLDRVVPDRPAFLTAYDGHTAWVNSRALELAAIDARTPDPEHGRFVRDPDGTPTGALVEDAQRLVTRLVPEPTLEELVDALTDAQRQLHALGITAWHDPGVNPEWLPAYRALAERGGLTARVVAAQQWQPWGRPRETDPLVRVLAERDATSHPRLRADVVKFWLDGVFESRTAYLLAPYLDPDGREGTDRSAPNHTDEELRGAVSELERRGFDCHFHAIGDAAARQGLDAVEAARAANGARDARHSMAHLELVDRADIPRFAALGVAANLQMLWAYDDDSTKTVEVPMIGTERYQARYAFGSLRRADARLAAGSDWTVTSANPLEQMEVGIRRAGLGADDPPWQADECLDLDTTLAAFTIGSAWVSRLDVETGTIDVGKQADLVVFDRDLRAIPGARLSAARVQKTFVEGVPVFAA